MRVNGGALFGRYAQHSKYYPPRYLSRKSLFMDSQKSPNLFIVVQKTALFMDSKYYLGCSLRCPKTTQHWHKLHLCAYCAHNSNVCNNLPRYLSQNYLFLWTQKSPLCTCVLFAKVTLFMDSKNSFL